MGCGHVKSTNEAQNNVVVPDPRSSISSNSNVLLRYETVENVYKIKLVKPKIDK